MTLRESRKNAQNNPSKFRFKKVLPMDGAAHPCLRASTTATTTRAMIHNRIREMDIVNDPLIYQIYGLFNVCCISSLRDSTTPIKVSLNWVVKLTIRASIFAVLFKA